MNRDKKLTNLVEATKIIANRAPSKASLDERSLMQAQIQLLAEILSALWRSEKK